MSLGREQREQLRVRVLTGAGWLEGTLHLEAGGGLAAYVSGQAWYPMTDVVLARVGTLPFFALSRAETLLVVVPAEVVAPVGADARAHPATLLLPTGVVDGAVHVGAPLRLSDFLQRGEGFVPVRGASVRVWSDAGAESFAEVLLNPQRLVGVTEREA